MRYLERLRIFISPTCVSLWYGHSLRPAPAFLDCPSDGVGIVIALDHLIGLPPSSQRPGAFNLHEWCRNISLPSIRYAFRPRVRARLTLGGFTFPRKP